jgi:hypothetical protein
VKKAVDSNGDGKLADDDQFKAAFKLATDDYVTFTFMDYQASLASYLDMVKSLGGSDALDKTAVDDELVSLVPAWFGSVGRFESDALVASSAFPSVDIGYDGHNKKSTLLGWAPPDTIAYGEVHDAGAAITALPDRFRKLPEGKQVLDQVDATTGIGLNGIFGWWGDTALVVSADSAGKLGGGLVIAPTDAAAGKTAADSLRGLLAIGGGQAGIKLHDVQHGDATITVVDFSGAPGTPATFPAGYKPELAFTFTDQVVVIGYGQSFVESVLDAGPGPSLADDAHFIAWYARFMRQAASPNSVEAMERIWHLIDIRPILPTIRTPTLVMHRTEDRVEYVQCGRDFAERIPGARFVELPGGDNPPGSETKRSCSMRSRSS